MVNSLYIGKAIYNILSNDLTIKSLVNGRIFPLMVKKVEKDVVFPFIVYSRRSVSPSYCKDGGYEDVVMFSVVCASTSYDDLLDIASAVRSALECKRGRTSDIDIADIRLDGCDEMWLDNAYYTTLNFKIVVR